MSPTRKARFKRNYLKMRPWKRHSLVLMVAGLAYIAIGLSYLLTPTTDARELALSLALEWFPIEFWGSVWIIVGLMAVVSSRWPPIFESWGYMALTGLSAGWSGTYLASIIVEPRAPITNLSAVVVWGLMAFLWWAVSGLLNPDKEAVSTEWTQSR